MRYNTDHVLEDEIPADDEGHQLADRDVTVDVSTARLGHPSSEFRIAESCKKSLSDDGTMVRFQIDWDVLLPDRPEAAAAMRKERQTAGPAISLATLPAST